MAEEKKSAKTKDAKPDDSEGETGAPVPTVSATGTPSAGKHEPANPKSQGEPSSDSGGDGAADSDVKQKATEAKDEAKVKITEVTDQAKETVPEATSSDAGSGGDVGSGPTGGITPGDVDQGGGNAVVMSGAAFTAGLVTGLLIGWFASG